MGTGKFLRTNGGKAITFSLSETSALAAKADFHHERTSLFSPKDTKKVRPNSAELAQET
jgi:hypothetical protein